MGQPPNRPLSKTPTGHDWEDLRRLSINTVRKFTSSDDGAEDIAQEVLFKLWRTEHQENKRRGFVQRATKNLVIDRYRHRIRQRVTLGFDESSPGPEALREATLDSSRIHRPDLIAELDSFLVHHDPSGETFGQLFALSCLSAQKPAAGISTSGMDSPPASPRAASSTLRRSSRLRHLGAHFAKQGVSWRDVLNALAEPGFLLSSSRLARLAADQCATQAEQLCEFARDARIDLVLRAGADRHTFDLRMQRAVWTLSERMMAISRLPALYMLLGGLRYLQRVRNEASSPSIPVHDVTAQRRVLAPFLSKETRASFAHRWLATALYGVMLEYADVASTELDDELSKMLRVSDSLSFQKVGVGWSWHNAARVRRDVELRSRLLRAVPPDAWPAGLAALPTVIVSPYLSGPDDALLALLHEEWLWNIVLRALASPSHVAVAGGLIFLDTISINRCPGPMRKETERALMRLSSTSNPFLAPKVATLVERLSA